MANPKSYEEVNLSCASHDYPIYIGVDLLSNVDLLKRHISSGKVLIVTNDLVAPLYLESVQKAFAPHLRDTVIIPDGEVYKNQTTLMMIYDALVNHGHHRDTTLVALGGGVVGDITGFAAATFQRGVRFLQLPTTLLAQVDASIGGKTAINHPKGKNMIGSFHQPQAVIISLNTLTTLPEREFRAGIGEIIKYALLVGGDFFNLVRKELAVGLSASSSQLPSMIAECCRIKAGFVQEDERDQGLRALLNLGHTFAHALEAITNYQRWLHGEAVGMGLYCAAKLSYQLGFLELSDLMLTDALLECAHLPRRIPKDIDRVGLKTLMLGDKKVANEKLRFVLMRSVGDCFLDDHVSLDDLDHLLLTAVEGDER
ncbi:MAG: 3-dehydroquinate synthase [Legionellales bacterium]|nr:3-dehydroquinate synthase [Legionellales bacterium]